MEPGDDDLQTFLTNGTFPAERECLIADAIDAGASSGLVDGLRGLPPDHLFRSAAEVAAAMHPSLRERID